MQHSEWAEPTQEEYRELETTELECGSNNGKGNNTSVPVNDGIIVVLFAAVAYGYFKTKWKLSRS